MLETSQHIPGKYLAIAPQEDAKLLLGEFQEVLKYETNKIEKSIINFHFKFMLVKILREMRGNKHETLSSLTKYYQELRAFSFGILTQNYPFQ